MPISVGTAVTRAAARTRYVLFSTFDIGKWLALALCAFLSQCDSGSFASHFNNIPSSWFPRPPGGVTPPPTTLPTTLPSAATTLPTSLPATFPASMPTTMPTSMPTSMPGTRPMSHAQDLMQAWANWISANAMISIALAAGFFVVLFALAALCTWISSRGKFMFIDGIVQNRAAIVEPWRACGHLGNSLLGWSLALNFLGLIITALIIGLGAAIAWPDIRANTFSGMAITAIAVTGVLMIANALTFMLVRMLLNDFVVPAMYLHNLPVRPAWQQVKREIVTGYVGEVVLFYLMGILLTIVIAFAGTVLTCATCCVTAIPFVGTVIMLPFAVFMRCYGLCFIEQFGPRWTVFFDANQRCRKCGYDLRYSPQSPVCPECGTPREDFMTTQATHPPISPGNMPPTS